MLIVKHRSPPQLPCLAKFHQHRNYQSNNDRFNDVDWQRVPVLPPISLVYADIFHKGFANEGKQTTKNS